MPRTALLITHTDDPAVLDDLSSRLPVPVVTVRQGLGQTSSLGGELEDRTPDPTILKARRYDRVYLQEMPADLPLPAAILREIFSHRIKSIEHVDGTGGVSPHRPFARLGNGPRALSVVPGGVVPLDRGARRRIFELTLYLNRVGLSTDLLMGALGPKRRSHLENTLQAIAPRVYTYRKIKSLLPARLRLRR